MMVLSGQHHIVVRVRGSYRARVRVDCLQHRAVESARDGKGRGFPWIHHGAIEGGMRLVSSTMKEGMHADPSWNHAQAVHHAPCTHSCTRPPLSLSSAVHPWNFSSGIRPTFHPKPWIDAVRPPPSLSLSSLRSVLPSSRFSGVCAGSDERPLESVVQRRGHARVDHQQGQLVRPGEDRMMKNHQGSTCSCVLGRGSLA